MRAINFGFWDAEDPAAIVNINAVSNQLSCVAHRIKCNNIEDENWDMAIIAIIIRLLYRHILVITFHGARIPTFPPITCF